MPMDVILFRLSDEFSPSGAGGVDNRVVVFKTVFESQFWRRYCQTFSTGLSSGARDGRKIGGDVFRYVELARGVPSGSVEKQHGVGARSDVARDFVEVKLHHVGVGMRKRERGADAPSRADSAEQIGVVIALVGRLAGPRSAPGPLANLAVLLADPGPVLTRGFPCQAEKIGSLGTAISCVST
jgi:hypothetical protein